MAWIILVAAGLVEIGWAVGLFLAGLAFGSMTNALLDAAQDNELLARVLAAAGTDGVYTTMTQFLAAAVGGYAVAAVLRAFHDEEAGLAEPVLAAAVSRWQWLLTAVAAVATMKRPGSARICTSLVNSRSSSRFRIAASSGNGRTVASYGAGKPPPMSSRFILV